MQGDLVMISEQNIDTPRYGYTNPWSLAVGPDICHNVQTGFDHEWLVTNGLGGYAAGSIVGATTRSYHGLLVAAMQPPAERTVMVTKIDEAVDFPDGSTLKLGVNEYLDTTIDPQGYNYLDSVVLEGDVVCFTYTLKETLTLEKRIWMEYGKNITYVQYALHGALDEESTKSQNALTLTLWPFCLTRDHHSSTQGSPGWHFIVENQGNTCCIRAFDGAPTFALYAGQSATFAPTGLWYWNVFHRRERERGLLDHEDVYQPGYFRMQITPGMHTTLVLSVAAEPTNAFGGPQHEDLVMQALLHHQRRIKQLLAVADRSVKDLSRQDPVLARLIVAADQFIVARPKQDPSATIGKQEIRLSPDRKTIIAGYPWFTDWGRDTMISLPGLLLDTGRYSEARGLFKAFASFMQQGLIPNRFPDGSKTPEYNTVDATLWMFHALDAYLTKTGDWSLLKHLFPLLRESIRWHITGTSYGIGVDANDGLLCAGVEGVQLTWMDAKVGDWVVTPRHGKPVEVNALWYRALSCMENWAVHLSTDATQYSQLRTQVRQNFAARFWYEAGGYLYDVVDVEGVAGKNDPSLRPNQLFAAALTRELLTDAQVSSMLEQVTKHLLTPLGLRTLSPEDPAYHKHFNGKREARDEAYHQGTVWPWLIGAYIDVHLRVHNDRKALRTLLQPIIQHLWSVCLGTISEVAEPEPPFTPSGCFAQAWSVAEVLRCWQQLAD
jgi:predicted glycogen debranching enzyme